MKDEINYEVGDEVCSHGTYGIVKWMGIYSMRVRFGSQSVWYSYSSLIGNRRFTLPIIKLRYEDKETKED